jgi:hypothetical protein
MTSRDTTCVCRVAYATRPGIRTVRPSSMRGLPSGVMPTGLTWSITALPEITRLKLGRGWRRVSIELVSAGSQGVLGTPLVRAAVDAVSLRGPLAVWLECLATVVLEHDLPLERRFHVGARAVVVSEGRRSGSQCRQAPHCSAHHSSRHPGSPVVRTSTQPGEDPVGPHRPPSSTETPPGRMHALPRVVRSSQDPLPVVAPQRVSVAISDVASPSSALDDHQASPASRSDAMWCVRDFEALRQASVRRPQAPRVSRLCVSRRAASHRRVSRPLRCRPRHCPRR